MSLKDRFIDYWTTNYVYEDYKYDITILEELVYGFIGTVGGIIAVYISIVDSTLYDL